MYVCILFWGQFPLIHTPCLTQIQTDCLGTARQAEMYCRQRIWGDRQSVSEWVSLLFQGGNSSSDSRAALLKIQLNIELLHWISLFVNAWPASAYSKLISFPLAIDLFIYLFRFYCMLELRAAVNRYQIYFPLVLCYISRSKLWGVDGWEMN